MAIFEPTLRVARLVVLQGQRVVFDEKFLPGVNIIRGENSSGKTSIMDFIAFVLGAESIRWKPEALRCSQVLAEVSLNGKVACFRREVADAHSIPTYVYWGALESALVAAVHQWESFPFRRSEKLLSSSQVAFNALNIPQAQGDGASNLTMHQILRVLYADQPSVHSPIFRLDRFDNAIIRATVGWYLTGIYDDNLLEAQLRMRELGKELEKLGSELVNRPEIPGDSGL